MAKSRKSKRLNINITAEQFENALGTYASFDARECVITSRMDDQITKIREKYAAELNELKEGKEEEFEVIQAYCMDNEQLFSKKKSMETVHGIVGFRTGTPKLKPAKGFTWPAVTKLMEKIMPEYIRSVKEANKENLLADREKPGIKARMSEVGVEVVQDETFYIDLKKEAQIV